MKVVIADSKPNNQGYRRRIVGLGINEPDAFLGYGGFNGLSQSITRLSDGQLLMAFNSGYWHASLPTPIYIEPETLKSWVKEGFPADFDAPSGGRAMLIRSFDEGVSWNKPELIIDTPENDAHPNIVELNNGTLVCVFFTHANWYGYKNIPVDRNPMSRVGVIKSFDKGRTWQKEITWLPTLFPKYERLYSGVLKMLDGSVMIATYGCENCSGQGLKAAIYSSNSNGDNWKCISVISSNSYELDEPTITVLPSGRLMMIARPDGAVSFSDDSGKTWSEPKSFGIRMYAPVLLILKSSILLCIFGSYASGCGGLQAIFSADEGQSWIAPASDRGFPIDDSAYGYGGGCEMADGSIYCVYYDRGTEQQRKTAVFATRFKIREDKSGIDMLKIHQGEIFNPNTYNTTFLSSKTDIDAEDSQT